MALAYGWQAAPAAAAALALFMAAALETVRRSWDKDTEARSPAGESPMECLRLVWRMVPLRWLSGGCFCYSAAQLCLVGFLVTLLVEEVGFTLLEAGFALSLTQVMGVAGRVIWGWLADRVGDGLGVLAALGLLMALGAALAMTLGPGWTTTAVLLAIGLFGATAIGWNGVYIAEIARLSPPGTVGTATGGSLSIIFAGVLVGPSVFAALYAGLGSYTQTFALPVLFSIVGALAVMVARGRARRE
jgi:predicted MFS family arabinose efflux permease